MNLHAGYGAFAGGVMGLMTSQMVVPSYSLYITSGTTIIGAVVGFAIWLLPEEGN